MGELSNDGWRCAVCQGPVAHAGSKCPACYPPLAVVVAEMRALGVTRLKTADMEVDLGPDPQPPAQTATASGERDAEADAAQAAEKEWYAKWTKLLRSSGSPVPPFPKQRPAVVRTP